VAFTELRPREPRDDLLHIQISADLLQNLTES